MRQRKAYIIEGGLQGIAVDRFDAVTSRLHYDTDRLEGHERALEMMDAQPAPAQNEGPDHLVLFCIGPRHRGIEQALTSLKHERRKVVVLAHEEKASTARAIDYCHSGLCCDFIVVTSSAPEVLDNHLRQIDLGRPIYPRFDFATTCSSGTKPMVFISTPFLEAQRRVMSEAVDPALAKLDIEACWADQYTRDTSIADEIRQSIAKSFLLIANISRAGGRHNPNVYYEAGQATALKKPVIFVRPLRESALVVPADISARRRVEYGHEIELALRLYHGLKGI